MRKILSKSNEIKSNFNVKMNRCILFTFTLISVIVANPPISTRSKNFYRLLLSPPNYFTTRLFQKLANSSSGNLICAPLSTQVALAVLAIGTHGKTFDQLRLVLHDLPIDHYINPSDDSDSPENELPEGNLHLSNQLFISNNFEVKPEYIEAVKNFRSGVQKMNFTDSKLTSYKINTWCEQNTNERVTNLVAPGTIYNADLIVTSSAYLKGEWVHTFPKYLTIPTLFNVNEYTKKVVATMRQRNIFSYGVLPAINSTYIKLPYKDSLNSYDDMSMYIILPDELGGLRYAEQNLHKVSFYNLHLSDDLYRVQLSMPKFKIESEFNLNNALKAMRITDIFTTQADFSGITDKPLKVDKVLQKTFIEVDERGAESASVIAPTAATSAEEMSNDLPFVHMNVNHPFLVVITSGPFLVFGGRVVDPKL